MNQIALPHFGSLNNLLAATTMKLHASQVHGMICGMHCGDAKSKAWQELVADEEEAARLQTKLHELHTITVQQMNDPLFRFQLCLPEDDDNLPLRAEALTLWCQGFLTGLKLTQVQIENRQPSETTEAIADLIEIAKMNYEEVVVSEEDESAYTELVEFVRTAVILIYQELLAAQSPAALNPNLSSHLH